MQLRMPSAKRRRRIFAIAAPVVCLSGCDSRPQVVSRQAIHDGKMISKVTNFGKVNYSEQKPANDVGVQPRRLELHADAR